MTVPIVGGRYVGRRHPHRPGEAFSVSPNVNVTKDGLVLIGDISDPPIIVYPDGTVTLNNKASNTINISRLGTEGGVVVQVNDNGSVVIGDSSAPSVTVNDDGSVLVGDEETGAYSVFEGGVLRSADATTLWRDINYNPNSLGRTTQTAPAVVNLGSTDIEVAAFESNATDSLSATVELQHDYWEGSDPVFHIHLYPTDANAGNVKFGLEYSFVYPGETPASNTIYKVIAMPEVAWQGMIAPFEAIDGSALKMGAQLHFRIYRDPSDPQDTYGSDVAAATIGIHYLVDTRGSRTIHEK